MRAVSGDLRGKKTTTTVGGWLEAAAQCEGGKRGSVAAALRLVPGEEDDLAGGAAVLRGQVQVHQGVPAVVGDLRQLVGHVLVRLAAGARGLDHDLRVVHDLVDEVAEVVRRALQLEVVELRDDLIIDTDTGRLRTGDKWQMGEREERDNVSVCLSVYQQQLLQLEGEGEERRAGDERTMAD
ncbi:hypothetical protein ON010_g18800 [Phytophthora cinnamomi]|nr:hypothetical protein ON010_g18800 [Phytophthora cinnamomi]